MFWTRYGYWDEEGRVRNQDGRVIYELPSTFKLDQAPMALGQFPVQASDLDVVPDRPGERWINEKG